MKISSLARTAAITAMAFRLLFCCSVKVSLASGYSAPAHQDSVRNLKLGQQLELEINPGKNQTYELALAADARPLPAR